MIKTEKTVYWLNDLELSVNDLKKSTQRLYKYLKKSIRNLPAYDMLYFNFKTKQFLISDDYQDQDSMLTMKIKEKLYIHTYTNKDNKKVIDFDFISNDIKNSTGKFIQKQYKLYLNNRSMNKKITDDTYFNIRQTPFFIFNPKSQVDFLYNLIINNEKYQKINLDDILNYVHLTEEQQTQLLNNLQAKIKKAYIHFNLNLLAFKNFIIFNDMMEILIDKYIKTKNVLNNLTKINTNSFNDYAKKHEIEFLNHIKKFILSESKLDINETFNVLNLLNLTSFDFKKIILYLDINLADKFSDNLKLCNNFYLDFTINPGQLSTNKYNKISSILDEIISNNNNAFFTKDSFSVIDLKIQELKISYKSLNDFYGKSNKTSNKLNALNNLTSFKEKIRSLVDDNSIIVVDSYQDLLNKYDFVF